MFLTNTNFRKFTVESLPPTFSPTEEKTSVSSPLGELGHVDTPMSEVTEVPYQVIVISVFLKIFSTA